MASSTLHFFSYVNHTMTLKIKKVKRNKGYNNNNNNNVMVYHFLPNMKANKTNLACQDLTPITFVRSSIMVT